MPVPAVPAEIVLHVLDLATSDLIEAERLATPPAQSTNAFLAAASLVSKTWRPIAQSLLLRKGIIPLPNIDSFLEEIRKRGIRPSTVRVSAGNPTLGTTARGATDDPGMASIQWETTLTGSAATIIRVANTLPALRKLVVPEYWRGEELEEYCDGCGVELVVYDHLMLGS
ncbi:hypothetical protein RQP46_003362 [Phenoliferia psychrophenolica]